MSPMSDQRVPQWTGLPEHVVGTPRPQTSLVTSGNTGAHHE